MNKRDLRHYICLAAIVGSFLCSVFVFPSALVRFIEGCIDFGLSIAYYFCELFGIEHGIDPSVKLYSVVEFKPIFEFPLTWKEFTALAGKWWRKLFDPDNFRAYNQWLAINSLNFARIVTFVIPLVILAYVAFDRMLSAENNDYNKESKALTWWKRYPESFGRKVKKILSDFWAFVLDHKAYLYAFLFVWAWNFHFVAVFVEFFAYYFYFAVSFDFASIYRQFIKLFLDLSVVLRFLPVAVWILLGLIAFDLIRKNIGYSVLNHMERKNRGFINERPIVLMVCGTMGKKKTTMITDMALSQEIMFRDKAFELMLNNDMKFPCFPWINLENALKREISAHRVYNLATCRLWLLKQRYYFELSLTHPEAAHSLSNHLKNVYGYKFSNLCFGYDYIKYGLSHNDSLKVEYVFDVLISYAQLYFIYVCQSSLLISNYSIRSDQILKYRGNLPLWDNELFRKDPALSRAYSRHAHILDFDALRLGRQLVEENEKANSFEFGVVNITEIGKERGNNLELQEVKKSSSDTNQKNDLFNAWLKLVRHSATVDNFPFVKVITDDQRPESWGADARDLCEVVNIDTCSDIKLAMPFYIIEDVVISWLADKFRSMYVKFRYNRGDMNLPVYLLHRICAALFDSRQRIFNTFGLYDLRVLIESGRLDGTAKDSDYYVMCKKIYSRRFSTDCFSDYFAEKSLSSALGINDLPEFKTEKASLEELMSENSYWFNSLTKISDKWTKK